MTLITGIPLNHQTDEERLCWSLMGQTGLGRGRVMGASSVWARDWAVPPVAGRPCTGVSTSESSEALQWKEHYWFLTATLVSGDMFDLLGVSECTVTLLLYEGAALLNRNQPVWEVLVYFHRNQTVCFCVFPMTGEGCVEGRHRHFPPAGMALGRRCKACTGLRPQPAHLHLLSARLTVEGLESRFCTSGELMRGNFLDLRMLIWRPLTKGWTSSCRVEETSTAPYWEWLEVWRGCRSLMLFSWNDTCPGTCQLRMHKLRWWALKNISQFSGNRD